MNFLTFEQWVKLKPANDKIEVCPFCKGDEWRTCLLCDGNGDIERFYESGAVQISCPDCNGEGHIDCSYCAGTGLDYRSIYDADVLKAKKTIKQYEHIHN